MGLLPANNLTGPAIFEFEQPTAVLAAGAADMSCDAANVRASVVAALELLSTKRAARLPKKHGNMAL